MGSYAYLTAGIITARQAELMKNAFWPMLRQGLLYTIPLTLVSFAIGVIIAVLIAFNSNKKDDSAESGTNSGVEEIEGDIV